MDDKETSLWQRLVDAVMRPNTSSNSGNSGNSSSGNGDEWQQHQRLIDLCRQLDQYQQEQEEKKQEKKQEEKQEEESEESGATKEERLEAFRAWLQREGFFAVDDSSFSSSSSSPSSYSPSYSPWIRLAPSAVATEGNGLYTDRPVAKDEYLFHVPRKFMLTVSHVMASPLGAWIRQDPILSAFPSFVLVVGLLDEYFQGKRSFFHEYISVLPRTFSIPLFFSAEECQELKGSPVLGSISKYHRNTLRQYVHLVTLLKKEKSPLLPVDRLSWRRFVWATAAVITRQNEIPIPNSSHKELALIMVWDMCNHRDGALTSFYDTEKDALVCHAMEDFAAGAQIYIYYGPRPNSEFFLYSGFVPSRNARDRTKIRLGISKADPLLDRKRTLLAMLAIPPTQAEFDLCDGPLDASVELLLFVRVFVMTERQLTEYGSRKNAAEEDTTSSLRQVVLGEEALAKPSLEFLRTRLQLLLKSYPTSVEDDMNILSGGDSANLSEHRRLAVEFRLSEKRVLVNALNQCSKLL